MDYAVHIACLHFEFHFPEAQSLKEKRAHLRRIRDRLGRFNCSIAEVGYQNLWQRAVLCAVVVSGENASLCHQVQQIVTEVECLAPDFLLAHRVEYY